MLQVKVYQIMFWINKNIIFVDHLMTVSNKIREFELLSISIILINTTNQNYTLQIILMHESLIRLYCNLSWMHWMSRKFVVYALMLARKIIFRIINGLKINCYKCWIKKKYIVRGIIIHLIHTNFPTSLCMCNQL